MNCVMCGLEARSTSASCPRCGAPPIGEESSLSSLLDGPMVDPARQQPFLDAPASAPGEPAIPAPMPLSPPRPGGGGELLGPPTSPPPPPPAGLQPVPVATASQRLSAYLIDILVLSAAMFVIMLIIALTSSIVAAISESLVPVISILGWLILIAIPIGYLVAFNARGQTLGKRVFHIAVVDHATGRPIGLQRSALRTVMMFVMGLPLGMGYLSVPLSAQSRGWHDRAADDVVVSVSTD